MNVKRRSAMRSGSILVLAALLLAPGCMRPLKPATNPQPLLLQTVVAVDRQGNQILAGTFPGRFKISGAELVSAGGTDIFLVKTDPKGQNVFPPQRFGGKGDDAGTGVAVDEDGSIILVGTFQGEASFGSQTLKAEVRHEGQRAVFVARFTPAGQLEWVKQIAVANLPTQISVAIRPDHTIVVGASGVGTVANRQGEVNLGGASIMLNLISPKGDVIPPAGGFLVESLTVPVAGAHSPCAQGGYLDPSGGADNCVAWICGRDPYCCNNAWDGQCVSEVGSICVQRCDCNTMCSQGIPFNPGACACSGIVFGQDPYCSENSWDGQCVGEAVNWCHIICH
jgi:hypothetical protein